MSRIRGSTSLASTEDDGTDTTLQTPPRQVFRKVENFLTSSDAHSYVRNTLEIGLQELTETLRFQDRKRGPLMARFEIRKLKLERRCKVHLAQTGICTLLATGDCSLIEWPSILKQWLLDHHLDFTQISVFDSRMHLQLTHRKRIFAYPHSHTVMVVDATTSEPIVSYCEIEPTHIQEFPCPFSTSTKRYSSYSDATNKDVEEETPKNIDVAVQELRKQLTHLNYVLRNAALIHHIYTYESARMLIPKTVEIAREHLGDKHPFRSHIEYLGYLIQITHPASAEPCEETEERVRKFISLSPHSFFNLPRSVYRRGYNLQTLKQNKYSAFLLRLRAIIEEEVRLLLDDSDMSTNDVLDLHNWARDACYSLRVGMGEKASYPPIPMLTELLFLTASYRIGPWFLSFDQDLPRQDSFRTVLRSWNMGVGDLLKTSLRKNSSLLSPPSKDEPPLLLNPELQRRHLTSSTTPNHTPINEHISAIKDMNMNQEYLERARPFFTKLLQRIQKASSESDDLCVQRLSLDGIF